MSWHQHLPALQVVVPLLAAPATVLLRRRGLAYVLATTVSLFALYAALQLWLQVRAGNALSYAIGNWPPPWGIEYRVDTLSAFVLVLIAGDGRRGMPFARRSIGACRAPALPLLHDVPAVPDRPAGHDHHRRRLQRLRVPGNLLAVQLRADRDRPRPARPDWPAIST
jgi:hypothetical protein